MNRASQFFLMMLAGLLAATLVSGAEPPFGGAVRFEQHVGERLPLGTMFTDAKGGRHPLGDYFHGKPVVLYFGYARCPQLCSLVADGTVAALRNLRAAAGSDYEVVSLSIDPQETPDQNRHRMIDAVRRYGRPGDERGWNFIVGDEAAIHAVTDAAGFYYSYDPGSRQYAHPSGFLIATPDGTVSRYFMGLDFESKEVAQALARAGQGKTGQPVLELLLVCFHGGGITGRYVPVIWEALEFAVVLTVLALAGGIGKMLWTERRARASDRESAS